MSDNPNDQNELEDLANSLALVRATLESTTDGILVVDKGGHIIDCNQKFIDMWGIPPEYIEQHDERRAFEHVLSQVTDPDALYQQVTSVYDDENLRGELGEVHFKDGRVFERYSQPHRVDNEIVGRVWSFRDITERKNSERELSLRNRAIEASSHGIMITNADDVGTIVTYVNPALERITGYKQSEMLDKAPFFLKVDKHNQVAVKNIKIALKEKRETTVELQSNRKDGSLAWYELYLAPVRHESDEVSHYVSIINDITQRKNMEEQLVRQATHDTLTSLPNRSLLSDRLEQCIIQARNHNHRVAILFMDLDHFKLINDSMGHSTGDLLLVEVAKRIKPCLREGDTFSRWGGDEFVILLSEIEDPKRAKNVANRILKAFQEPFIINEKDILITASIGINFYPDDGVEVDSLMRNADMAMYKAKESGRNNLQNYSIEMEQHISKRMQVEHDLRHALGDDQFELYYQPLVRLDNNQIIGAEGLIRWIHPDKGMIPPMDFIDIAEETGIIVEIGEWVIETVSKQITKWQQTGSGYEHLRLSLNVSGKQLERNNFFTAIKRIIMQTHTIPELIDFELTETVLMHNISNILPVLDKIREIGGRIVIDDFGTGYSSFSYLRKLPIDKIKIDRSFVTNITSSENDLAIASAIIAMAKQLNLAVLAEGIETKEHLELLFENGCEEGQGFYFSKPTPVNEFLKLVDENKEQINLLVEGKAQNTKLNKQQSINDKDSDNKKLA